MWIPKCLFWRTSFGASNCPPSRQTALPDAVQAGLMVNGDSQRLVQVVTNVLANAAKFTPARKSVHLSGQRNGTDCLIVVRDEGQGVEPQLLSQIFDLFAQGQQGPDGSRGGLGLGLAIARTIVAAHNGTIDLSSAGTGHGATVAIRARWAPGACDPARGGSRRRHRRYRTPRS